MIYINTLILLI